ncbi:uncharacterized protein [Linepithema humile]|uniref:uncharacterized protein n=1 Tax=Linepithema humile TaxID=83485 RepID=UPI00062331D5|nr:PREDICTED: uncharacterized protein LOC105676446 [Linepithema humile]
MLRIFKYILYSTFARNMYQISVRRKSSKADKIKKLMKEYKSVFGTLVETKAEKKKRLKLEKKGKISQQKSNDIDTEFSWVMENSGNNLKKIILESQNVSNSNDSEEKLLTKFNKSSTDENVKTISHFKYNQVQKIRLSITNSKLSTVQDMNNNHNKVGSITESSHFNQDMPIESSSIHKNASNSNTSDIKNTSIKYVSSKSLSDIIIKNLLSFPIMGSKQESSTESTEIFSISGMDDPETIKFPSVTRILTETMPLESKLALEAWKKRMINQLGQEGFEKYQKALLEDGASLHSCIMHNLLEKDYEVPSRIEPVFKSVQHVLEDVRYVKAVETHVAHTKLRYKGIIDCVASYRGENYVIDWKKSDKKKLDLKQTYDGPIQIAAYIGAINASNLYPFVIKRGLLVIAYTCGTPATVHEVCDNTLQRYWTAWLHRLQKYYVETANNDDNKSTRR